MSIATPNPPSRSAAEVPAFADGTLGDGAVREQVVRALRLWLDLTGD